MVIFRRILGKTRPPTPPIQDNEFNKNEYSTLHVFDDGSILSNQMVNFKILLFKKFIIYLLFIVVIQKKNEV